MNILDLVQTTPPPRRVSTAKGGEYHSPCPQCGGSDRFHIWPGQREYGTFWCRGCGICGDAISYLRIVENLDFKGACQRLGVTLDALPKQPYKANTDAVFLPREAADPINQLWQAKAEKLVEYAHQHLLTDTPGIQYLAGRGITLDAIVRHHLGLLKQDHYRDRSSWGLPEEIKPDGKLKKLWLPSGLVIPAFDEDGTVTRLRIRRPQGDPRYFVVPGSGTATWICKSRSLNPTAACVVVESELDAITIASAVDDMHIISLGNASSRPDETAHRLLDSSPLVLAALDYDAAGKHGYHNLKKWYGSKIKRWPTPDGKDAGEYAELGGSIAQWLKAACV